MNRRLASALFSMCVCACSSPRRDRPETGVVEESDVVVAETAAPCVAPTPLRCGDTCVDRSTDPMHCGNCSTVCGPTESGAAGTGRCTEGRCSIECPEGRADCDGMPANGCEVTLASSAANCGRCGNACPARGFAVPACSASACGVTCDALHNDCNDYLEDGCESLRAIDPEHCGSCETRCPWPPRTSLGCSMGACTQACRTGYLDCDGNPANGCETSRLSARNCGACGNACGGSERYCAESALAVGGAHCVAACPMDSVACDLACVRLDRDPDHCGSCLVRCPEAPNAQAACRSGSCGLTCRTDYADCDGDRRNGCEITVHNDARNCGTCGNACPAGQRCAAGSCHPEDRRDAGPDGGGDASTPDAGDDCEALSRYAYVVTAGRELYRFDPAATSFESMGMLRCAGAETASVRSMTVDPQGNAWVLFAGGGLFTVDLRSMRCTAASFDASFLGTGECGMGFAAAQTEASRAAALYLAPRGGATLYRVLPDSLATTREGDLRVPVALGGGCPEDAGTSDAGVPADVADVSEDARAVDALDETSATDASAEASMDAGLDAGLDAGIDASVDARVLDSPVADARADAGAPFDAAGEASADGGTTAVPSVPLGPSGLCVPSLPFVSMAGTADGRLYALVAGTDPMQLVEVRRDTLAVERGWRVPGAHSGAAAVAALGGSFWVFAGGAPTGSGRAASSQILRFDASSMRTTPVVADVGFTVVGAGAVACRRP